MSKRSIARDILEHLIICGSSLMVSALFTPYGQSLSRAISEAERQADRCPHDFSGHSKGTVSTILTRLKTRGLVANKGPKKKTVWQLTKQGRKHFQLMSAISELPSEDGKMRLVIFDIPEGERGKRAWLRSRLFVCGYRSLQKSVWIGTRPLPEELHAELTKRELNKYVHVVGLEDMRRLK